MTYSAARWPSGSSKVMECTPGDYMCLEKYRKNAAMIQIFYEELNYETLQETPAYTVILFELKEIELGDLVDGRSWWFDRSLDRSLCRQSSRTRGSGYLLCTSMAAQTKRINVCCLIYINLLI